MKLSIFLFILVSSIFASGISGGASLRISTPAVQASAAIRAKSEALQKVSITKEESSALNSLSAEEKSKLLNEALGSKSYGEEAKKVADKLNEETKKKILSKDIGSKVKIDVKKEKGSVENDLPVAVLGVNESIEDYLIEKNKIDRRELIRERHLAQKKYSLEDQAAFEFRRRYKSLYWKRYRNKRWDQFVKDNWTDFKIRYIEALKK